MGYQLPIIPDSLTIAGHTVALGGTQNLAASDLTNGTTGSGEVVLGASPTVTGTITLDSGIMGVSTSNPYSATYPAWMKDVGGQSFPNTNPLALNALFTTNSSVGFHNQIPFGELDTAVAANFAAGSLRPAGITGYSAPWEMGIPGLDEFGAAAITAFCDSRPVMLASPGTFTATTFVPTTPITLGGEITIGVGMFMRTGDSPCLLAQVSGWTVNGSAQVTAIDVTAWYVQGESGTTGTPSSGIVYLNPIDKPYTFLPVLDLNAFTLTGNTTAGGASVTAVLSGTGHIYNILPGRTFVTGTYIPANTIVRDVNLTTNTLTLSNNVSAGGTATGVTLTFSCGAEWNAGVTAEFDVENAGPAFTPMFVTGTGDFTAGSPVIQNVSDPASFREGLILYASPYAPPGAHIETINVGASTMTMDRPAGGTATSVTIKAGNRIDEAGTGIAMASVNNNSNTGYLQTGNFSYGFQSMGAGDTGFLVYTNGNAAIPRYGFRLNGEVYGHASLYDFAVTDSDTVHWGVTGTGDEIAHSITATTIDASTLLSATALNVPFGSSVSLPAGYAAQIHATTNANLLVGPGAFFGGTGLALISENDATNASEPLMLVASTLTLQGSMWTANGTTAVSLTSVAPAGAHATVQEWLTVLDSSGATRYVPCF